jgi:hypothetical protein
MKNATNTVDSEGDIEYMTWKSTGHNGQRTDEIYKKRGLQCKVENRDV